MDFLSIYREEHLKNGLSYSQIREKYNIPRGTWDYYVRYKLGLSADRRKYRCNDTFFDIIDSEIKAYLLGFLYADGYLSKDGRIGILLNAKDIEILELIQKYICPNTKIVHLNYTNIKRSPQVKLRFKSKKIYNKLVEFGFTTDKTHHHCKILCKIPENFKKDFIRGYTDGDGSIRFNSYKNCKSLGVVWCNGVPEILEEIQEYFSNKCKGYFYKYKNYYTLSYYKKSEVRYICESLYSNCNFYLSRKYKNAMSSISYCYNTELTHNSKELCEV